MGKPDVFSAIVELATMNMLQVRICWDWCQDQWVLSLWDDTDVGEEKRVDRFDSAHIVPESAKTWDEEAGETCPPKVFAEHVLAKMEEKYDA
jgi:hypothetical protein